jgi:hypothetical protein
VAGNQPLTIAEIARAANPPGSHQGGPVPMPANMGPLWKGGERMPAFVQMRQAALNNIANNTTATTTSSSNELHVGSINVNAPGVTDAHGVARHIDSALAASMFANAANYGPN